MAAKLKFKVNVTTSQVNLQQDSSTRHDVSPASSVTVPRYIPPLQFGPSSSNSSCELGPQQVVVTTVPAQVAATKKKEDGTSLPAARKEVEN